MINKQAIDTMTQMLSLITKYAKGAYLPHSGANARDFSAHWTGICRRQYA